LAGLKRCWRVCRATPTFAIANRRLIALDDSGVTFRWKNYRAKGRERFKLMTLGVDEFIRRFWLHVLPSGFHRIRRYGLFVNGGRAENIAQARQMLNMRPIQRETSDADGTDGGEPQALSYPCPCCGGRKVIIETFERGAAPSLPRQASEKPNRRRRSLGGPTARSRASTRNDAV
jgi:hypothetical protein